MLSNDDDDDNDTDNDDDCALSVFVQRICTLNRNYKKY